MIIPRKAEDRGSSDLGWLQSRFSFSFAEYHDPDHMGWSVLRVINDDLIAPGTGFGTHGHRDMEIVTYMGDGVLRHGDSMQNSQLLRRGEVQRMSAGKGILHSEMNGSDDEAATLLQIWIEPAVRGIRPEYEQKEFPDALKQGRLQALVSPDGRDGSMVIHQDALIYASILTAGQSLAIALTPGRRAYLHVVAGSLSLNGQTFTKGDGARIADECEFQVNSAEGVEFLWFDLP
jgi:redox-sensitive bicupin YhaK (pirin superfamily)